MNSTSTPSIDATGFGHVDHPQTLKYVTLLKHKNNAWRHFKSDRPHQLYKLLKAICSIEM
jgi:hypothetical protein